MPSLTRRRDPGVGASRTRPSRSAAGAAREPRSARTPGPRTDAARGRKRSPRPGLATASGASSGLQPISSEGVGCGTRLESSVDRRPFDGRNSPRSRRRRCQRCLSQSRAGAGPGSTESGDGRGARAGRQRAQGRAGRRCGLAARRDRRRAGGQRRGVRALLRAEGRAVTDRAPRPRLASRVSSGVQAPRPSPTSPSAVAPNVLPAPGRPLRGVGALAPHGTTIVAATFPGGVVVAGDRRATMGNVIAQRDIEKVFPADEFSIIGIAGAAGHRGRAGPAVPGRAGALREDRGRAAVPGRQGQPAGHHDPAEPRPGPAGPGRGAAVRRLGPGHASRAGSSPTTPRAAATRSMRSSRSAPARSSPAAR